MSLGLSVRVPAKFEFIRCELSEEVGADFCDFIEAVDLDDDFYGLVGEDLSSGRMHFIMRGVVGLYLEAYDMAITLILEFEISIDKCVGNASAVVEVNDLLARIAQQFQVFLVVEETIAVYSAFED